LIDWHYNVGGIPICIVTQGGSGVTVSTVNPIVLADMEDNDGALVWSAVKSGMRIYPALENLTSILWWLDMTLKVDRPDSDDQQGLPPNDIVADLAERDRMTPILQAIQDSTIINQEWRDWCSAQLAWFASAPAKERERLQQISQLRSELAEPKHRADVLLLILERDGYGCHICSSTDHLQIDHKHPVSKGGNNDIGNLQLLCRSCNASKGNSTPGAAAEA